MARRSGTVRRPGQKLVCGWCGRRFKIKARGRTPKWCSASCRQRAWEQRRAADSGLAAVEVVDRAIEHDKVVYVVEDSKPPTGRDWAQHIGALTRQVERGTYYDRPCRRWLWHSTTCCVPCPDGALGNTTGGTSSLPDCLLERTGATTNALKEAAPHTDESATVELA